MFSPKELIFAVPTGLPNEIAKGQFAKGIWILALAESNQSDNTDFLKKVLSAAQLDLERDTLFAEIPESEPVDMAASLRIKPAAQVLVFGIPPKQLGLHLNAPVFQPFAFYGTTWLFADALSVLEPDKTKKGLLWTALKTMFLNS
ncbi:MAG TPA: hypothetical protein PLM41_02550 [Saprospiraceae bacterium]|nr:hypothetical protein [Saprospiraceae bacterium]